MRVDAFFTFHDSLPSVLRRGTFILVAWSWIISSLACAAPLAVPVVGDPFRAELSAIDANGRFAFLVDRQTRHLGAADLVCWGQAVEQGLGSAVVLADGSVLMAEIVAVDQERLTVESAIAGSLKFPLETLAGIVFSPPSNRADRDRLFDRLVEAAGDADRVLLLNGDELPGRLVRIADATVNLETDVGPLDIKADRIGSILLNPSLRITAAKSEQRRTWTVLSDGSRLLATHLTVNGEAAGITAAGQSLTVPPQDVVFVQPLGGRAVYLSDLKPTGYRQTPYLDLAWPYRPDRSVAGGGLRAGGRLCLKGLGVHSAARLEYDVAAMTGRAAGSKDAPAAQFQAEVAIDDSTDHRGSVTFRVLVDGREKFASGVLRGGDSPSPVAVDITGAKRLELLVDYADRVDILDRADWLNARITR